jgi:SAM-dependent methyltransferase
MKLHRLLAYKVYRRLDGMKEEIELLKWQLAQSGSDMTYGPETVQALKQLFERYHESLTPKSMKEVMGGLEENADCRDLAALFTKHGSDKSTRHDYHFLYEYFLRGRRQAPLKILEIGIGTNQEDVLSHMGPEGKPGASLRAFSEWAPQAELIGADIDTRVLFNEGRIKTFFVDQLKPETIRELCRRFAPHSFDLIVDDGLHTPEANLNFLLGAIDLLKEDGTLVIEDVAPRHLVFWTAVSWALDEHRLDFVQARSCCAVVIRKKSA